MKISSIFLIPPFLLFLFGGCRSLDQPDRGTSVPPDFGVSRFFVISDPHFLSPELYDRGTAFYRHMLYKKGNLTEYGSELLEFFRNQALREKPDYILVTGDLTNNGEKESHIELARYFSSLEKEGIDVFVIPGNHDVEFPYPFRFSGDDALSVSSLSAGEFLGLYGDFGYDKAFTRDDFSLSYAVELQNKAILIGLDSCRYGEGAGYISRETMAWLENVLEQSRSRGKSVLLFMHHSLLEHFEGQDRDREMKLKNREELIGLLRLYGVKIVFTGHYHAQDIASIGAGEETLFDIETGSLISWPFPYRDVVLNGSSIIVREGSLESLFPEDGGWQMSYERIYRFADNYLRRYGVKKEDREKIASYVSQVLLNHYAGDEESGGVPEPPAGLSLRGRLAMAVGKRYYQGRISDEGPPDGELTIETLTGEWTLPPPR